MSDKENPTNEPETDAARRERLGMVPGGVPFGKLGGAMVSLTESLDSAALAASNPRDAETDDERRARLGLPVYAESKEGYSRIVLTPKLARGDNDGR